MAGLIKYDGNFVKFADSEFDFSGHTTKNFGRGIQNLDLRIGSSIAILPSPTGDTIVEIDTEQPENFSIYEDRGTLVIEEKNSGNNNVVIQNNFGGGRSVTIAGNGQGVSIIGGEVYIGGKRVDQSRTDETKQVKPSRIRIFTNHGVSMDASIFGVCVLASKVVFREVKIDASGQSTVGFAAKESIEMKLAGQGDSFLVCQGGELDLRVSGMGSITTKGEYSSADVSVSGMGSVKTSGVCLGNYRANLSGMGSISHSGEVKGRVKKNVSGMGSISGLS